MAAAIVKGNLEAQAQDTQMRMGIIALAVALGVATASANASATIPTRICVSCASASRFPFGTTAAIA